MHEVGVYELLKIYAFKPFVVSGKNEILEEFDWVVCYVLGP